MDAISPQETLVRSLGPCRIPNPLLTGIDGGPDIGFVTERDRVLHDIAAESGYPGVSFEKSGPMRSIYFSPNDVTAAVVTCGGLCPGLNNVIRSIVMQLYYKYGVRRILGIQYGFGGLDPETAFKPLELTPEKVSSIHEFGGSILGTSRGTIPAETMLKTIEDLGINLFFCLGGDGTQRGLHELSELALSRGREISFIGLPKTIDNDIAFVHKTFGLSTAVTMANEAINSAHFEAQSAFNGIGLVKVMGRYAGFIACYSTLANLDVNFCLIPEVDFDLDGPGGFLETLERRLYKRKHAVIVVAEGAGQKFFDEKSPDRDASGNAQLNDIGLLLKNRIKDHFKRKKIAVDLKYIDPSYMVRSMPTDSNDSIYTADLGRCAVHAGMAGKTDMLVGHWHGEFINVPLPLITANTKLVTTKSKLWTSVLEATGQPASMKAVR